MISILLFLDNILFASSNIVSFNNTIKYLAAVFLKIFDWSNFSLVIGCLIYFLTYFINDVFSNIFFESFVVDKAVLISSLLSWHIILLRKFETIKLNNRINQIKHT